MTLARYHTGTKADTLLFLQECDRQDAEIPGLMSEVEVEQDVTLWDTAVLECRICGKRSLAVVPTQMQNEDNECHVCGNMTADVIESLVGA